MVAGAHALHLTPLQQRTRGALSAASLRIGRRDFPNAAKRVLCGRYEETGLLEAWILTTGGRLYFTSQTSKDRWQEPYPLGRDIGEVAGWRNPKTRAIDLFYVNADNALFHLYQDQRTSEWVERPIALEAVDGVRELNTYTTQVTITDENRQPARDRAVTVRASQLSLLGINGNRSLA